MTKPMPSKTLTIDGDNIDDISSFYAEINRVFMADENWKLGPSLDALNDMLYGAYGAIQGDEPVVVVWKNMEKSRAALGLDSTTAFYEDKLKHPETFDISLISRQLDTLRQGTGPTYFEIVLEILAGHSNIRLEAR